MEHTRTSIAVALPTVPLPSTSSTSALLRTWRQFGASVCVTLLWLVPCARAESRDIASALQILKENKDISDNDRAKYVLELGRYEKERAEELDNLALLMEKSDPDVATAWAEWCSHGVLSLAALQREVPLDKVGLRDFGEKERSFFEALKKTAFASAKKEILTTSALTATATADLDARWEQLRSMGENGNKAVNATETKLIQEAKDFLEAARKWAEKGWFKTGSTVADDVIKFAAEHASAIKDAAQGVVTRLGEEKRVMSAFNDVYQIAAKLNGQIDYRNIEKVVSDAKSTAGSSDLTNRQDFGPLKDRASNALDMHAGKAKDGYAKFLDKNAGRFLEHANDAVAKTVYDEENVLKYLEVINDAHSELTRKLDDLKRAIDTIEDSSVKSAVKDAESKLESAETEGHKSVEEATKACQDARKDNHLKG